MSGQWESVVVGILMAICIVVGAHIVLRPSKNPKESSTVVRIFAFGVGAFFTAVCLDFLPDAWSGSGDSTPLWLFLGAFVLWAATNLSDILFNQEHSRQLMGPSSKDPFDTNGIGPSNDDLIEGTNLSMKFTSVSAIVLATALSFHTFFEGAAVALAFHHPTWTTLGFSIAMILHKLPEGVLWGLALVAVYPRDLKKIRLILIIPAACTLVGVFLGIFLTDTASSQILNVATGFVAGAMFYIAFAELLPALRESSQPRLARSWFIIGLVVMFILNRITAGFGG